MKFELSGQSQTRGVFFTDVTSKRLECFIRAIWAVFSTCDTVGVHYTSHCDHCPTHLMATGDRIAPMACSRQKYVYDSTLKKTNQLSRVNSTLTLNKHSLS